MERELELNLQEEFNKIREKVIELRGSKLNPCKGGSPNECPCNSFDKIVDTIEDMEREILTFNL
tara:strand:- start:59 stop:250 length:192 start_codon:yes stop_codon:yes gene_type:complete